MKLSIILPTFNSAKTLKGALDSIVCQTFTDWEVLIMDGVSKDNTLEIAKSFNNSHIRIYSEPDKGIYDAMNKGIKKANGTWLYFLGSDDWLYDNTIFDKVFSIKNEGFDIIYGDVSSDTIPQRCLGEWSIETIDYNRCHQAIFYRRSVFNKLGLYNTKYRIWADYDLNLKWFFSRKIKSQYIPIVIAHFSSGGYSDNRVDNIFLKDEAYLKLVRGNHLYDIESKRSLLNEALQACKKENYIRYLFLSFWKNILRINYAFNRNMLT